MVYDPAVLPVASTITAPDGAEVLETARASRGAAETAPRRVAAKERIGIKEYMIVDVCRGSGCY